jgi:hypothetical protein
VSIRTLERVNELRDSKGLRVQVISLDRGDGPRQCFRVSRHGVFLGEAGTVDVDGEGTLRTIDIPAVTASSGSVHTQHVG